MKRKTTHMQGYDCSCLIAACGVMSMNCVYSGFNKRTISCGNCLKMLAKYNKELRTEKRKKQMKTKRKPRLTFNC